MTEMPRIGIVFDFWFIFNECLEIFKTCQDVLFVTNELESMMKKL